MTESPPDLLAALTEEVERLRRQVTAWDKRLNEEGPGAKMVVLNRLKQFGERLDEAIANHRTKPPPAPWWGNLSPAEYRARLEDLHAWVEGFLRPHYAGYLAWLPRCWPNHREAVWELSAIRTEWERIFKEPDEGDLSGLLAWHDRYLPGVLARLKSSIECDERGCQRAPPRPTA